MPQLRQGTGLWPLPKPLDGRHQAPLRPEPPKGEDPRERPPPAHLRMHAVPQGGQGNQGGLEPPRRSKERENSRARGRSSSPVALLSICERKATLAMPRWRELLRDSTARSRFRSSTTWDSTRVRSHDAYAAATSTASTTASTPWATEA